MTEIATTFSMSIPNSKYAMHNNVVVGMSVDEKKTHRKTILLMITTGNCTYNVFLWLGNSQWA